MSEGLYMALINLRDGPTMLYNLKPAENQIIFQGQPAGSNRQTYKLTGVHRHVKFYSFYSILLGH